MASKNQTMTLQGYDSKSQLCELKREQPFSDVSGKHYGMPQSTGAFLTMLYNFWLQNRRTNDNPFSDVFWVEFSKASLFRILSQENCEFVRFYFAMPDEGINKASLAMEGLCSNGDPIKLTEIFKVADSMIATGGLDPEMGGEDISAITADLPPNHEERGNGGPGIIGAPGIKSLADVLNKATLESSDDFKKFLKAYYNYAQETF